MNIYYLLPIIAGGAVVLQTGLNEILIARVGLSLMVVLNAISFLVFSGFLLFVFGPRNSIFAPFIGGLPEAIRAIQPWHIICGTIGVVTVGLGALSFQKLGSAQTILLLIVSQIVFSVAWRLFIEGKSVGAVEGVGLGLMIVGTTLFSMSSKI